MSVGERVELPDETFATVTVNAAEAVPSGVTVYNLTVGGDHTYFVDDGGAAVWVHNAIAYTSGENIGASIGRRMHEQAAALAKAQGYIVKVALRNGKIPDAFKIISRGGKNVAAIVRELKPDNARAVTRGLKQLDGYARQISKQFKVPLDKISKIIETY